MLMQTKVITLHVIDSTNSWAKREWKSFDRGAMTVVSAKGQTAGYGRFHRRWISPVDQNIYTTFCFFTPPFFSGVPNIAQVVGLALVRVLTRLHFNVRLKWPNDIFCNGKKIGGVLCETIADSGGLCILAGLGVNINMGPEWLTEVDQPATSLFIERGVALNLEAITAQVIETVAQTLVGFLSTDFSALREEYLGCLIHASGDWIRVRRGNQELEGRFLGINQSGLLLLQLADNSILNIASGDIGTVHI